MKKSIIVSAITAFALLITTQPAQAGTYLDPHTFEDGYAAGDCIMVNTQAEVDTTHVYTLNPDNTIKLNSAYMERWQRNARCDELQFHIDHNTPLTRLKNWLDEIAYSWYSNIGATHLKNKTVSTSRHEWFYVDENGLHRIPDWPTGLSRGLLIEDRISIFHGHTDKFYQLAPISTPLNFSDGQYADKINDIWKEGDRDYSNLPTRLAEELGLTSDPRCGSRTDPCSLVLTSCQYVAKFPGDPYNNLFNWSWMLTNPGCPLAE